MPVTRAALRGWGMRAMGVTESHLVHPLNAVYTNQQGLLLETMEARPPSTRPPPGSLMPAPARRDDNEPETCEWI